MLTSIKLEHCDIDTVTVSRFTCQLATAHYYIVSHLQHCNSMIVDLRISEL